MHVYWLIVFFIFGITFGSFFNVVGLRLPKGLAFSSDRSYCPHCQHQLTWLELIPIFSFFLQKGACRHCHKRISFIYPLVELFTGLLFSYAYWHIGLTLELVTAILLVSLFMIVFVSDITYMIIPNKLLLFFLPWFMIMRIVSPLLPWYDALIGAFVGFTVIAAIILISGGGMGAGDMKLFGIIGIILGWQATLLTLFLAALLGAVLGSLIMWFQKSDRKQPIPFGPYIIVAALISYFYGAEIIRIYLTVFNMV